MEPRAVSSQGVLPATFTLRVYNQSRPCGSVAPERSLQMGYRPFVVHFDSEYPVYTLSPHLVYGVDYRRNHQAACDIYYGRIIYLHRPCAPPRQQPVALTSPKEASTLPNGLLLLRP